MRVRTRRFRPDDQGALPSARRDPRTASGQAAGPSGGSNGVNVGVGRRAVIETPTARQGIRAEDGAGQGAPGDGLGGASRAYARDACGKSCMTSRTQGARPGVGHSEGRPPQPPCASFGGVPGRRPPLGEELASWERTHPGVWCLGARSAGLEKAAPARLRRLCARSPSRRPAPPSSAPARPNPRALLCCASSPRPAGLLCGFCPSAHRSPVAFLPTVGCPSAVGLR